jgi:type IV pilus assembly protein PilF
VIHARPESRLPLRRKTPGVARFVRCCALAVGLVWFLAACSTHSHRSGIDDAMRASSMAEAGLSRLHEGDHVGAEVYFQHALALDPTQSMALLGMGSLQERKGDASAALDWYSTVLANHPEDAFALTNHGDLLCRSGYLRDGLLQLEMAIERSDSRLRTAAQVAAGTCALAFGDYQKAEIWLREALSREPEYPEALLGMAQIALFQDRLLSSRAFISRLRSLGFLPPEAVVLCREVESGLGNHWTDESCGALDESFTAPERIGMTVR